jgi:hypothetical protein
LQSKNLQLKNGMDAIFEQRKGLEGRSSLLLAVPITGNGAWQAELALAEPRKARFFAASEAPQKMRPD